VAQGLSCLYAWRSLWCHGHVTATDAEAITQTVLDYFEGWFDGDVVRMGRALHPELAKRRAGEEIGLLTKARMLELAGQGHGAEDRGDGRVEVTVHDVYRDIATASVASATYHEYLHLVRTSSGWQIANTLWQFT
jgi:Putative lumazine-binding